MPEEQNPINQKLRLTLEQTIKGDDLLGHLKKVEKSLQRTQKFVRKYDQQFQKHSKTIKRALPNVDRFTKQQTRLTKSVSGSLVPMRRQLDLLKKTRREMSATTKVSQGLRRSLSRIAGVLGVGGLGFLALQRIRKMMDSRLNLAVTGGADQIKLIRSLTGGRNTTSAIDLAARFQQQSPYSRFGLGDQSIKGLVALQRKLEPIGLDLANDLILGVTKGLEPQKLQGFLQTATVDPRRALLGAASGGNVEAVTSALNALEIGGLKQENKLDPMLQAATEFKETGNRLADAFDKLSANLIQDLLPVIQSLTGVMEKIAGVVGGLSTKELIGYGLGAYVGYKGLKGLGGAALRGLGRGFPPGVQGMPTGGFGGGGGFRVPGMQPALPAPGGGALSPALRRLPWWRYQVTGGALGYGLPAAAAAGSVYTAGRSAQTAVSERQALKALETTQQDDRLFDIARKNKTAATTELDRLRAERQNLDARISTSAPVGDFGIKKDFIGKLFGFYGDFPQGDQGQLDRLREQRAGIQRQIQALKKQQPTSTPSIVTDVFDTIKSGLDKAKQAAERFKTGLDNLVQKGMEANLKRLQQQAAKREELTLTATEQGVSTQLSRLEFDLARTTPFGTIGAMSEYRDLQKQLSSEIESLNAVMDNIDQSTQAGRIEAARMNVQIKGLRLEQKTRGLEITKAMLDSIQAQAFNAGKFEKIIFTQDQNVRKGLQAGVVKAFSPITGSTGHPSRGRKPVKINPASNAVDAVKNMERASRDLAAYLESIFDEDELPHHIGSDGNGTIN